MSTVPVSNKADALKASVEGEKAKVNLAKATWLDQQFVEELRIALKERAHIKHQEEQLESHKKDVVAQVEVLMESLGIASAYDPAVGSATRYSQDRTSLNQSRLKEELLHTGMPAEVIIRCFDKATTHTTSSGLKFTPV
jgi:hypothetical protein